MTEPVIAPWKLQRNVYSPGASNVRSIAAPPGLRVSSTGTAQLVPVDVSECVTPASSNSQRTVAPVGTVTEGGSHAGAEASVASITVGACADAALAVSAQMSRAATSATQSRAVRTDDVDVEAISFLSSLPGRYPDGPAPYFFRNAE